MRKRRLEKHLLQTEVAAILGVDRVSVQNWERGVLEPTIRVIPRIITFLGYDPEPEPQELPQRLAYARRRLGWRQEDLAHALAVSLVAIWKWESGRSTPPTAKLSQFQHLLHRAKLAGITLQ